MHKFWILHNPAYGYMTRNPIQSRPMDSVFNLDCLLKFDTKEAAQERITNDGYDYVAVCVFIEIRPEVKYSDLLNESKEHKELWNKTDGCTGTVVSTSSGGAKCTKCNGWFCY